MSESKAPKCPGCGRDMELFQIAAGGWRYGCLACATSFKSIKRKQYGWISPIKSTKERAHAAAMLATEPKWISVKDRLPAGEVLAANFAKGTYGYKEYIIGYVDVVKCTEPDWYRGKCYAENDHEILNDVTHWMPLPEPPKEG